MSGRSLVVLILATIVLAKLGTSSFGEEQKADLQECEPYHVAATNSKSPIPDELLAIEGPATKCLSDRIRLLEHEFASGEARESTFDYFNTYSGALLTLISRWEEEAIKKIRKSDDIRLMSVLGYAARSDNRIARLNATLLAANIVDNTTVCVVIDHLAYVQGQLEKEAKPDPDSALAKARANLLGIISVVAPWAYKENFQNISRVHEALAGGVIDPSLFPQTVRSLENIKKRLEVRANAASVLTPELSSCKIYTQNWAQEKGWLQY